MQRQRAAVSETKEWNLDRMPSFSLPYLEIYGMRMIGYACRGGESRRERDNTDRFSHQR